MAEPRLALDELIVAFEKHYTVASNENSSDDEILEAEDELLDAFFTYDDALFTTHGVEIPIDLLADFFEEGDSCNYSDSEKFADNFPELDEDDEDFDDLDEDI